MDKINPEEKYGWIGDDKFDFEMEREEFENIFEEA
jgi:hypothetical protein